MPYALVLELARVRLEAARATVAAAEARLEKLSADSDEAIQAACELITLRRAIMSAQVEVDLAHGPVGA